MTRITPVVLIGVWLIFLPTVIGAAIAAVSAWIHSSDLFTSLISTSVPLFVIAIGTIILLHTTRRYALRNSKSDSRMDRTS